MYSLTIQEAEVQNQGVVRVDSFWRLYRSICRTPFLSQLLVVASNLWSSLAF